MTNEEIKNIQKMAENLRVSLDGILNSAHDAIKKVAETDPEKADELLKDLARAREAKDMSTINEIREKYANSSK
jgi:DNA-directed RNA polymerase subunit F